MHMTTSHKLGITLAGVLALNVTSVRADTFGSGGNAFTIDFVNIGNAGNANDAGAGGGIYSSPYGGVSYEYRMGVTEVPQHWITKATNLGMLYVVAGQWGASQPATNMTWYEAAAFVNWLNTSTGHQAAYQLDVGVSGLTPWSSSAAWQVGGENLFRHKDAFYFLPSEDEWYKAAYHKNDGVTANYWDYPTASNAIPLAVSDGTDPGTAVFSGPSGLRFAPAGVDSSGGLSAYGTRGQGGNVAEYTESAYDGVNDSFDTVLFRGGPVGNTEDFLRSSSRTEALPGNWGSQVGFRVASVVPEPSCAVLLLGTTLPLLLRRRRATV
jgi:hypothetical protein